MDVVHTELKDDSNNPRFELTGDISSLRTEFKVDGQTIKAELIRWLFVAAMGQFAMLLGVLYFFMRYFK